MENSIFNSTKKILGVDEPFTAFDLDIMTHINAVFMTLHQLGVGPEDGFMIESAETQWSDFLDSGPLLNATKSYVYLRVKMLFDPPQTSFVISAINDQIKEMEVRLNYSAESKVYVGGYSSLKGETFWWTLENDTFPREAKAGELGYDPVSGNVWRKL